MEILQLVSSQSNLTLLWSYVYWTFVKLKRHEACILLLGENTLPVSSERISPPQSEVLYTEQLTLEGNINSAVNISPQPRRATIHSYSSSNHPESSTPETNRTNSVESDASFNAMLRRYSAAVTRPQFDNRTRYSYAYGDRKIQSISNVDPSKTSDLAAVVAMDYEVCSVL